MVCGILLTAIATIATADDAKDEAIKKDRKQIKGTWRVIALEDNGNKAMDENARNSWWSTALTAPGASVLKTRRSAKEPVPSTPRRNSRPSTSRRPKGKGKATYTLGFTS
jgi:hypothetical protein